MKWLRRLAIAFAGLLALILLWAAIGSIVYTPEYVIRTLRNLQSDVGLYVDDLPLSPITASSDPFTFADGEDPETVAILESEFEVSGLLPGKYRVTINVQGQERRQLMFDAGTEDEIGGEVVRIDLNRPMGEIRAELSRCPVATRLSLTGPMVVARDLAHARFAERLEAGEPLPAYLRDHPLYYAGPAKTPEGHASGSFGPTTAGRMDSYVERFQAAGGSLVMVAKGNRSARVAEACARHGGFYLGSIGGEAARLAKDCIREVKTLDYPELGMEAVWKIEVEDFPAFVVIDDKGNDFFAELKIG